MQRPKRLPIFRRFSTAPESGSNICLAVAERPRGTLHLGAFYFPLMLAILAALSLRPSISSIDLNARTAVCGGRWELRVSSSVTLYLETSQTVSRSGATPGRVALWVQGWL